jgi:hypothetical protein
MRKGSLSGVILLLTAATGCTSSIPKELANPPDRARAIQRMHRRFSAQCFNDCWALIDKKDKSPQDIEDMILCSSASMWHWKKRTDRKPLNISIGYGQLSRVYALAGQYDMAKLFGQRCLKAAIDGKAPPFYLGYAYEALTRAEIGLRNFHAAAYDLENARAQLARVTDTKEKGWLEADLDALKKMIPDKKSPVNGAPRNR